MTNQTTYSKNNQQKVIFKLDSGASDHLVNEKRCFVTLEKLKQPTVINVAKDDELVMC